MRNGKRTNDKRNMLTLRINAVDTEMINKIASEIGVTRSTLVRTAIHENLTSYLRLQQLNPDNVKGDMI